MSLSPDGGPPGRQSADGPPPDCRLCDRLAGFRDRNCEKFPDFHNAPVASFGALDARLLIVGLAPGLRGANQTGRPFTGDYAGDVLYPTLIRHGFARGNYAARPDDGLELSDCRITNAVRCVPPENKPIGAEINACRRFLLAEIEAMPRLTKLLALGQIAHTAILATLGQRRAAWKFGHAARHVLSPNLTLYDSYHCSRYNVNTKRLTVEMFDEVIGALAGDLGQQG